jgi:hypothetical protein
MSKLDAIDAYLKEEGYKAHVESEWLRLFVFEDLVKLARAAQAYRDARATAITRLEVGADTIFHLARCREAEVALYKALDALISEGARP